MEEFVLGPKPTPVANIINANSNLSLMNNEDILNLEFAPLTKEYAEPEIDMTRTHVIGGAFAPNELITKIPKASFDILFERASKMRIGTESYVTGLKIYFGIDGNNIFPVFQPLYLKRITDVLGDNSYQEKGELHYVLNGSNAFVEAKKSDYDKITAYQKNVRILHSNEMNHSNFRSGDTEGVIFPFQTIYTLLLDNSGSLDVYLYNAFRLELGVLQQCILLATKTKPFPKTIFENSYANRSHLCPPCTVIYSVYQRKP